jgi:SAM-dependent methyltransferase
MYVECLSCQSLYCQPMPDERLLARMYSPDYARSVPADPGVSDPKQPQRVVQWLRAAASGTFVDYGCGGDGRLLSEAARLNWRAIGVEYDDEVAKVAADRSGAQVVGLSQLDSLPPRCADVLHLGDVIEHLTDLDRQVLEILRLLRPGGVLLAQGPLEANANLFTLAVRVSRSLRRLHRTEMAPYHVLLATADGQRRFFERFGLEQLDYSVHEVDWPAPSRLSPADCLRPRPVVMFVLRQISKSVSALRPGRRGNRYFYAGQWSG